MYCNYSLADGEFEGKVGVILSFIVRIIPQLGRLNHSIYIYI